jgi:pilus assembly protein FimV
VNTKLDLAKAYEEMGDLEGARELLEEVVGEGPVDLVEQARAILARIGE